MPQKIIGKPEKKLRIGRKGRPTYTVEEVNKIADDLLKFADTEELPFLKKFCWDNKIPYRKFFESKCFLENKKFQDCVELAQNILEHRLVWGGLHERYNTAMTIFTLKNAARWRDEHSEALGNGPRLPQLQIVMFNNNNGIKKEETQTKTKDSGNGVHGYDPSVAIRNLQKI